MANKYFTNILIPHCFASVKRGTVLPPIVVVIALVGVAVAVAVVVVPKVVVLSNIVSPISVFGAPTVANNSSFLNGNNCCKINE